MKLQKTNTFTVDVKYHVPGEGPNVWRPVQFQATFDTLPQDELDTLRADQDQKGATRGLLDRVLVDVSGVETDEKKADGTPYTPLEIVKINQLGSNATAMAFWDAVNRDIEAKNSKKSHAR